MFEKLHYYYDYKDNLNEEEFLDEGLRPGLLEDFLGSQSPDLVKLRMIFSKIFLDWD